jgi:uncharacterized damage-inducible protein DinB
MSQEQELASFWGFISRSIERIIACLDGLSAEELNWRPIENANSLYILATHILGTTEENLLGVLCAQPTSRKREAEFAAKGASVEPIRRKWLELQQRIKVGLDGLPSGELERERMHPRRGRLLGREVLIVVARHATEHMGQAELTRDLLYVSQGKKPPQREY